MQNNATAQKPNKFYSRFQLILAITVVVAFICLVAAWFFPWVWHDPRPKPLGDRLEYIGKFDTGCAGFPCLGGGPPSATYYYATDMSMEEVMGYFKGADAEENPVRESEFTDIIFRSTSTKEGFVVYYHNDTYMDKEQQKQLGLKQTNKQVVSINASYYEIAQKSL
jgi:hypothetical protein